MKTNFRRKNKERSGTESQPNNPETGKKSNFLKFRNRMITWLNNSNRKILKSNTLWKKIKGWDRNSATTKINSTPGQFNVPLVKIRSTQKNWRLKQLDPKLFPPRWSPNMAWFAWFQCYQLWPFAIKILSK